MIVHVLVVIQRKTEKVQQRFCTMGRMAELDRGRTRVMN